MPEPLIIKSSALNSYAGREEDRNQTIIYKNSNGAESLNFIASDELGHFEHYISPYASTEERASGRIVVVSWSVKRLKSELSLKALIGRINPDIILLNDVENHYERADRKSSLFSLATHFNAGYLFAGEFVEDNEILTSHASLQIEKNRGSIVFGNAIISKRILEKPFRLNYDHSGEANLLPSHDSVKNRVNCAIGARISGSNSQKPVWVLSTSLNQESADVRLAQTKQLIQEIDRKLGGDPIIIGGNFNAVNTPLNNIIAEEHFRDPSQFEPFFKYFSSSGFNWTDANTPEPDERFEYPDGQNSYQAKRQWFFTRGLTCTDAATIPAIDYDGNRISNYDAIRVSIKPSNLVKFERRHPLLKAK